MLPNREGRFKANILEHGVAETGPNHLATFICKFGLLQEFVGGAWVPVDENFDITGYFYLEKKDGSINTTTVEALKSAFCWDGRDPLWLQDTDFVAVGLIVQVKLGFELYQGKERIKVQYVDAEDSAQSGVPKADTATRQSLSNRLGSKLRALAGGSPAPAPKPAGRPKVPAAAATTAAATATAAPLKAPPKPVPPELAAPATMQDVWDRFRKAVPEKFSAEQTQDEWFRILGELFPGQAPEKLTPDQWGLMRDRGIPMILPF